ncbi:hypothetical protein ZMO02_07690 [Zymomonas mobilis subsp. pomaceae]|uniref:Uncharacterized protein n=1 Tax=Zymomonas mobilis subsp. pomaceae (strain ATCC 29192 / DSM 22645 / JCM 10191 / CCUG 17912 / NBRC 13757 / NCIMB 11200 / NRRL B-4491 / Barker I) TaxID=579138 RepID=F8ETS5_ZYMMT|nr:hypothetical protein Zymop_1126 [Zymomonas mobilis subsp. pomaceae ATCC 29192]GEB89132.1 hypothetical protein ZMO02_07690 [Zymomonas mobilis subsp. pomaceae]
MLHIHMFPLVALLPFIIISSAVLTTILYVENQKDSYYNKFPIFGIGFSSFIYFSVFAIMISNIGEFIYDRIL